MGLYLGEIKCEPVGLTVAGSEILGTYEAGTDEKTFEGIVRHNFSNNVPHGYTFFIQQGYEILSIGSGSSDYPYNAFVVYWPNRSNGQPYFLGP